PPNVLVDDRQNVLHLSPTAGRFMLLTAGPLSSLLPAMVRPELRLDLRLALTRALDEQKEPTLTHPIVVAMDGGERWVALHVSPVPNEEHMGAQALVVFLDSGNVEAGDDTDTEADARPDDVRWLHTELKAARDALVASRNGREAAFQDSRASNEELQSINEEYRSTAEELETSKEELQSINEELHTVNAELKSKLASISVALSDLQNLTAATEIGTLFLDPDLRIRMFTPPIAELFNITSADVGRKITSFTHNLDYKSLEADICKVLSSLNPFELEVQNSKGRWFTLRLRPYRTVEDRIDGTVVSFIDITARRDAEFARRESEVRFRGFVTASSDTVFRMSPDWSRMHELDGHGFLADTAEPRESWMEHYIQPDDQEAVQQAVDQAIRTRRMFELEHRIRRADNTTGWILSRAVPVLDDHGEIIEWLGAAKDVTDARDAQDALRLSQATLAAVFEVVPIGLGITDPAGRLILSNPEMQRFMPDGVLPSRDADRVWRWRARDAEGRLLTPSDFPGSRALRGDTVVPGIEMLYVQDDGKEIWTQVAAVPIHDGEGRITGQMPIVVDIDALKRGGEALRESEHRLRTLMQGIPQLVWRSAENGLWTWSSPQWQDYTGQSQAQSHGWGWLEAIHPDDHDTTRHAWREAHSHGQLYLEHRVRRTTDGAWRWHQTRSVPLRGELGPGETEGRILEWLGTTTDIEDLKQLQGQQQVLVFELQHRTRNLLAIVRSLAQRSIDPSLGLEQFETRLAALSRVQGFLSRSPHFVVPLADLVQSELFAAGDNASDRVKVDGPAINLPGEGIQTVALALHELATNAVKYGAIAQLSGQLSVTWQLESGKDGRDRLVIDWQESGMELSGLPPTKRGYGSELITRALPYQLKAETSLEFASGGVQCRIILPAGTFRIG
ncbi:MAG: PAS domain S-box protein, partial [Janthinobacterium lividum]